MDDAPTLPPMPDLEHLDKSYIAEGALKMSWLVECLNRAVPADSDVAYVWSYTTNHRTDSLSSYYILWRTTHRAADAKMLLKAPLSAMLRLGAKLLPGVEKD